MMLQKKEKNRRREECDSWMGDVKNRHHSTQAQLDAFKEAIAYQHFGCFYVQHVDERYVEDFNDYA